MTLNSLCLSLLILFLSFPGSPFVDTPPIVCLDPGHPSELNHGNTLQNGLAEVHINWIIALEMKEILENEGVTVVLTRSDENQLVTNRERAEISNEVGADLFFRIHCDSFRSPGPHGMTFYYPDRQGTFDGYSGPSAEIINRSGNAAHIIHDSAFELIDDILHDRGVRTDIETPVGGQQGGALRGSIFSEVPVVLVEFCFLSNPSDAALISNPDSRATIVSALSTGILNYLESD